MKQSKRKNLDFRKIRHTNSVLYLIDRNIACCGQPVILVILREMEFNSVAPLFSFNNLVFSDSITKNALAIYMAVTEYQFVIPLTAQLGLNKSSKIVC